MLQVPHAGGVPGMLFATQTEGVLATNIQHVFQGRVIAEGAGVADNGFLRRHLPG